MIYGTCHIEKCKDDIESIGGISRIYINHRDEASKFHKIAYNIFKSPSYCHKNELSYIQKSTGLEHNKTLFTFDYTKQTNEFDDFDIIHAPGHCEGATFYRWKDKMSNKMIYR
eukprot:UN03240